MATFNAEIQTPHVPANVTVKLPGQKRGTVIPVEQLSDQQLQAISDDWRDALFAKAGKGRKTVTPK